MFCSRREAGDESDQQGVVCRGCISFRQKTRPQDKHKRLDPKTSKTDLWFDDLVLVLVGSWDPGCRLMKPSFPNNETVTFYKADIILVRPIIAYDRMKHTTLCCCYCCTRVLSRVTFQRHGAKRRQRDWPELPLVRCCVLWYYKHTICYSFDVWNTLIRCTTLCCCYPCNNLQHVTMLQQRLVLTLQRWISTNHWLGTIIGRYPSLFFGTTYCCVGHQSMYSTNFNWTHHLYSSFVLVFSVFSSLSARSVLM